MSNLNSVTRILDHAFALILRLREPATNARKMQMTKGLTNDASPQKSLDHSSSVRFFSRLPTAGGVPTKVCMNCAKKVAAEVETPHPNE